MMNTDKLDMHQRMLDALKAAREWLSGWASAEPYLSQIERVIADAEAQPAQSQAVKESLTTQQPAQSAEVPAGISDDLQDVVSKALRRAWDLGQTYWQQADSEYISQHKKADATQAQFSQLIDDTQAALAAAPARPVGGEGE